MVNINPGEAPLPKEGGQRAGGLGVIAVRKLPLLAPGLLPPVLSLRWSLHLPATLGQSSWLPVHSQRRLNC